MSWDQRPRSHVVQMRVLLLPQFRFHSLLPAGSKPVTYLDTSFLSIRKPIVCASGRATFKPICHGSCPWKGAASTGGVLQLIHRFFSLNYVLLRCAKFCTIELIAHHVLFGLSCTACVYRLAAIPFQGRRVWIKLADKRCAPKNDPKFEGLQKEFNFGFFGCVLLGAPPRTSFVERLYELFSCS
jgi:hypothetical protein